jgi:hypothetical protein
MTETDQNVPISKICNICGKNKANTEYYTPQRKLCKECEKEKRKELWYCEVCDRTYLKISRKKHIESKAHNFCKNHNVRNTNILPPQNRRRFKDNTDVSINSNNQSPPPSPEIEINDDMIFKIKKIMRA